MTVPVPDVRVTAARLVDEALASSAPIGGRLRAATALHPPRDGALLRELVLGTLTWLRRLDQVVSVASGREVARIDRALRTPLRLGVYQICFLDRIPDHAAVHEAVAEARRRSHRGGAGFVNAVLRKIAAAGSVDAFPVEEADPVARLAVEQSHPEWLVRRWHERLGFEETCRILVADNTPASLHVLAFRHPEGRTGLAAELAAAGCRVEPSPVAPLGLRVLAGDALGSAAFREGRLYVQNETSQLAVLVPPPRAGERVLDATAAPGGKTFSLLASEPGARCTVMDASLARTGRLRANARRLRVSLPTVAGDARDPPLAGGFDRVVLDAPCSGTGTLRRHPELRWRIAPAELHRLAAQTARMLDACAEQVRPGGLLQLITCSLEPEENEGMVAGWLAGGSTSASGFELADLESCLAADASPVSRAGLAGHGVWRRWTDAEGDGFSVVVLRRRGK